MNASVIVCTYNRAATLAKMLATLSATVVDRSISWELLVVDNNSTDQTRRVVERVIPDFPCPVRYLFQEKQGKSHALNLAISEARGELLLFTDDDVIVHPAWLQEIVTGFATHDCIGIGGRIEAVWQQERPTWYSDRNPYRMFGVIIEYDQGEAPGYTELPPYGANMAFRREAFSRYAHFRTELGPNGRQLLRGEDTEMSWQMLRAGERILYQPTAVIYHPVEPERTRKRYFQRFYFDYGRTAVRRSFPVSDAVLYFGVPRYLFRSLVSDGMRWLTASKPQRRFYYKLQCYQCLGEITEYYRKHKGRRRVAPRKKSEPVIRASS
jgi:glycosyltransferase involved in cell wall biosynthesis